MTIGPRLTPMVKYLVIACVVGFLMYTAVGPALIQIFGLTPGLVTTRLFLWQPFTYLFLHAGLLHLVFNMFGLWMFGSELELHWGSSRLLRFFFFTGVGAGVLSILAHPWSEIPTIGASGAIYGILMAYGMMFPERLVYLYFLFPVKVKYFVAILGLLAFLSAWSGPGSGVDHFAHLGGMLFGFLHVKGWTSPSKIRRSYYHWRLKRMERRFKVYPGGRDERRRKEDDFWIN